MDKYGYVKQNSLDLVKEVEGYERLTGRHVTVVAVTKSGTDEELIALAEAGALDMAENRPGELKRRAELLREHGYHLVPSSSGESQLLFAKGGYYEGTSNLQTHFIHVVRVNSREWFDYLNFRSYLIEYREIAEKYAELKLRLARDHSADRESYTAAKGDFIREVLLKASLYYGR